MTVYISSSLPQNLVWTSALSKFSDEFNSKIGASSTPNWSSNFVPTGVLQELPASVMLTDGAIGFTLLSIAAQSNVQIGNIINKAGIPTVPNAASVNFALI